MLASLRQEYCLSIGNLESETSHIVPTTSDPGLLTSSAPRASRLWRMRSEPHPLPTEPCASLSRSGSHSRLLSNAPLHHHLPPTTSSAASRPLEWGASNPGDDLSCPFPLSPQAPHLLASRVHQP